MKRTALFLGLVIWLLSGFTTMAVADCCGNSEVVNIDTSGFKNIVEYRCWPMEEKITFRNTGDYVIYNCTFGVGSPVKIDEVAHSVNIYPSSAAKYLDVRLNNRPYYKIEIVKERRKDVYGNVITNDFAKFCFVVIPEDLPNDKVVNFKVTIGQKPPKNGPPVIFSFRPDILEYPVR